MYLSQLAGGGVICRNGATARLVNDSDTVYRLALEAIETARPLAAVIERRGLGREVDVAALAAAGQLDAPLRHPDPAHLFVSGTGLTHLGSASARDAMHAAVEGMSDSMKMFRMGLENGKPAPGEIGVQPEWFYKGTGASIVAPGAALPSPDFALDGSEEPEIAGLYVIGADGTPWRVGYAIANEFSDHVMERINYLYLAPSKVRPAAFGPEIFVGELPADVRGTSRIVRDGKTLWEKPFLSGEENMSHTVANLEHHHFKYLPFRQPGDVHVHMFGTATLSFADGVQVRAGDIFEIEAPQLGLPLRNPVAIDARPAVAVKAL